MDFRLSRCVALLTFASIAICGQMAVAGGYDEGMRHLHAGGALEGLLVRVRHEVDRAELRRAGAEVTVASVDGLEVTASRGVKLVADILIDDCATEIYDLIALPGGMPGAEHLRDCKTLGQMLADQKQQGRLYSAICASPAVVLGSGGLLG